MSELRHHSAELLRALSDLDPVLDDSTRACRDELAEAVGALTERLSRHTEVLAGLESANADLAAVSDASVRAVDRAELELESVHRIALQTYDHSMRAGAVADAADRAASGLLFSLQATHSGWDD